MPCSSLLYQGQHRLPKKATAFLWPWVGRWALGIGKQPEATWHGWTAGVPGSRPHWLSALGDLEGHREACLSLMTPAATRQWAVALTHRPLEGCTCLSPLRTVGRCDSHVRCQHLFSVPPAWGWVWLCWIYLASLQRLVPWYDSRPRSLPGATLPALCLAIFILRVGNAFLQEAYLLDQSLHLHGEPGCAGPSADCCC